MTAQTPEQDNSPLAEMAGINQNTRWAIDFAGNGQVIITDPTLGNRAIAYLPLDNMTDDEADAIASCAAAAPEMLAALKEAIKTIKALHGPVAWDIYNRHSPEMQIINAAIAKAEGQS